MTKYRRLVLITLLALVASCAPTALPRPEGGSASPSALGSVATNDLITLREGGSASTIDEFDAASLELRRTAHLAQTKSQRSPVDDLLCVLHPMALAKRGFGTGAVLSPEGATLYALGETGVWTIDVASLNGRPLTKDGTYESLALSPDGARLYALGFDDGIVRAISTRDGTTLGAMKRIAFPSDIVAVDPGP